MPVFNLFLVQNVGDLFKMIGFRSIKVYVKEISLKEWLGIKKNYKWKNNKENSMINIINSLKIIGELDTMNCKRLCHIWEKLMQ